jgi:F-type H+-transporting ATPase subunit delta
MTQSALASRYARALVDVATEPKAGVDPRQVLEQLRAFVEVYAGSAELRNALTTPSVPPARKRAVVARIGEKLGFSRIARNFLFVLADHRRFAVLAEIVEAFDILLDERLGFLRAEISSARDLNPKLQNAVSHELERVTGKKVRMRFALDRRLIGGLVARIGSTVYDGSVRGQLRMLGKRLEAE